MKILALDTSTEYCSAAVWRDGVLFERDVHAGQRHSELLLPMIDEVLHESGCALGDLDALAFGAGPGTFTGLRIGCGVVQGLAFAAGKPVVPVGTLLAMAAASGAPRVVCCLDARMHEVYHAAYERTGESWTTVCEPALYAPARVPDLPGARWTGCGSGFIAYREALEARLAGRLERVLPDAHPSARAIAELALDAYRAGGAVPAEQAAPFYLRQKVALKTHERAA